MSAAVLVADDQPAVLHAVRLLLKPHGYRVRGVCSPAAVLAALEEDQRYDLLVMDLNYARDTTSGQEGLELLHQVRASHPHLPIVAMTAWSTVPLAVTTMREGVSDFIEKPWDNARLLAAVEAQVAEGRRRRRTLRLEADARAVQHRLLAPALPHLEGFEVGVARSVAESLGGDAYVLFPRPRGLAVGIADVCGKGTPAALLMASAQATLEDLLEAGASPAETCTQLGRALAPRLGPDRFLSLAYAELDRESGTLACANAGHPPPLLLRADGTVERLTEGGPVLGVIADAAYHETRLPLRGGDRLVFFTDGIVEAARDGSLEELGEARLLDRLRALRSVSAQGTAAAALELARKFAGGTLADDATVVVVDVEA
ncbi:MAG TPA: SpoIIE family protein phosphatase [Vicinamibacteria bacterium]